MLSKRQKDHIGRIIVSIACTLIIATGLAASLKAWPFYANYWGGMIFGPIAIAIGILGLYIAIFKYEQANKIDREARKKGYKSPLDNIKW